MDAVVNTQAAKKPANVSINSDLLRKAKELKINLSATLESALMDIVKARQRELWQIENRPAIEAYNQLVESSGVFSDSVRGF